MNSMSLLILTTELQMSPLLIMTVSATALYPELSLFSFTTADCPRLEDIPNGSLEVNTTLNITAAVYTCDEGFELVGESTRTCINYSVWSGEPPICLGGKNLENCN